MPAHIGLIQVAPFFILDFMYRACRIVKLCISVEHRTDSCGGRVLRYIVCSESLSFLQYVNLLRPEYGMYKLPWIPLPWFAVWFAVQIMGVKLFDFDLLKCTFGAS